MFNNKTVLITGGTGSFGKNFARHLLANYDLKKLIILSRDEWKQSEMKKEFTDQRMRFFLGDVRDLSRLQRAFNGVDIVVHAAALKQVPTLEYNPFEAVKTNIIGTQNVIDASIDQGVSYSLLVSTDKAAQPVNLYGSTKLCAEKLFVDANAYSTGHTKFMCVRYGNVLGSRGSIVESLLKAQASDRVYVTDENMTRFWITYEQAINLVIFALENSKGGEIFIPKIPSMKLTDLFKAMVPDNHLEVVGIRPGEKVHEVLLTNAEARHAIELEKYFVVYPEFEDQEIVEQKYSEFLKQGKLVEGEFSYDSNTNKDWLTIEDLRTIISGIVIS